MRVAAIVVARMGSQRLPGKVLLDVGGAPLLQRVLDRLARVEGIDAIVVATSSTPADSELAQWCADRGIACFRGETDDVAGRVVAAARSVGADAVARVNADSPWLDPELLSDAIAVLRDARHDLVTNVLERTWPYGISAETFTVAALERALEASDDPDDAEHVTRAFYARPNAFRIANLRADPPHDPALRLTVDTRSDLDRAIQLVSVLGERTAAAGTAELCELVRTLEEEAQR